MEIDSDVGHALLRGLHSAMLLAAEPVVVLFAGSPVVQLEGHRLASSGTSGAKPVRLVNRRRRA